jgi:hypothetical protein
VGGFNAAEVEKKNLSRSIAPNLISYVRKKENNGSWEG